MQILANKNGPPVRKRENKACVKNPKPKENKNHPDGESDSEKEDGKCIKCEEDEAENQVAKRVNGHAHAEREMSNGDVKVEAPENAGEEAIERKPIKEENEVKELMNDYEDAAKTPENGIHESEEEKESNRGQNRRARGKLTEGKHSVSFHNIKATQ